MTERQLELLVCVINQDEKLEELLAGFLKMGVTGATVIRSEGMGRLLRDDVPIFAGLQSLMSQSRPQNTTVMSVIEAPHPLEEAITLVQQVLGDLNNPSTGILFTLPVNRVVGLAAELDPETNAE